MKVFSVDIFKYCTNFRLKILNQLVWTAINHLTNGRNINEIVRVHDSLIFLLHNLPAKVDTFLYSVEGTYYGNMSFIFQATF